MALTKPNQELYEDLDGHAAIIDWAAAELIKIAKRVNGAGLSSDAMALIEVGKALIEQYKATISLADDTRDGLIIRLDPSVLPNLTKNFTAT